MEGITKVISKNRQTNNVTLKHNNQYFRTQQTTKSNHSTDAPTPS